MKRGEIWLVSLDPAAGHEQQGRRPVSIISPETFHRSRGGNFARSAGFAVPLTGTKTTGVIRCDQPRALHLRARNAARLEGVPGEIVEEVLARLTPIFE